MLNDEIRLFLILEPINGQLQAVKVFSSNSIENAILYFETCTFDREYSILKQIGIIKKGKFQEKEIKIKERVPKQINLFEEKEKILKASKAKTTAEMIKIIFGA